MTFLYIRVFNLAVFSHNLLVLSRTILLGTKTNLFKFYRIVILERKNSNEELATCLSQTRDRFEDEFIRSKAHKKYLPQFFKNK